MKKNNQKEFLTIPLSKGVYKVLNRISFAKKQVPVGHHTDTHFHRFFSAYLVKNMEGLRTEDTVTEMPKYALVLVFPRINHTWINSNGKTDNCFVSDLTPSHGEHLLFKS